MTDADDRGWQLGELEATTEEMFQGLVAESVDGTIAALFEPLT